MGRGYWKWLAMAEVVEAGQRNWAEIPRDALSVIFRKLGTVDVLWSVQAVCRPWRQATFEPHLYRRIDMRCKPDRLSNFQLEKITIEAIDRSGDYIEEFYAEDYGSNKLLAYLARRATGLRCLVLILSNNISGGGLAKLIRSSPLLEEIDITDISESNTKLRAIIGPCWNLKRFRLNRTWTGDVNFYTSDQFALDIADKMPQLRELQLIGDMTTNRGLYAILDNCLHLESLDIRSCFNIHVNKKLHAKLGSKIKTVRLPHDSLEGLGSQKVDRDLFSRYIRQLNGYLHYPCESVIGDYDYDGLLN